MNSHTESRALCNLQNCVTLCCPLFLSLSSSPNKMFPCVGVKRFLSGNVHEGALGDAVSQHPGCQLGGELGGSVVPGRVMSSRGVCWFGFFFLSLFFFVLHYFLLSCHRALPVSHESQPEACECFETGHCWNLAAFWSVAAVNVVVMDRGIWFCLVASAGTPELLEAFRYFG